jgi:very-short-patch-repair endonuclease
LRAAVSTGELIRVRKGWYAAPGLAPEILAASRVGGAAGCVTAARLHGLWVFQGQPLHVSVEPHTSRLRDSRDHRRRLRPHQRDVVVHWSTGSHPAPVVEPLQCLTQMARCQSPERTVAAVDSALVAGLVTAEEWRTAIRPLPARLRALLTLVDDRSGSIAESIARFRLTMLGVVPRTQVFIPDVGRVDLLVGERLVLEIDGWGFHHEREQFEEDRRRDAALAVRGYRVLRFSYQQVMHHWRSVVAAIRACISRGEHL